MGTDQSAGFLRAQVPGHLGADVALEAADGLTGQSTKDAVRAPFVVTQALMESSSAEEKTLGSSCADFVSLQKNRSKRDLSDRS